MMQIKTGRFKNKVECACAKHQSEIYKAFGNHNKICYLLALKSCNMTIIDTSDLPGLVLTRWADMQHKFCWFPSQSPLRCLFMNLQTNVICFAMVMSKSKTIISVLHFAPHCFYQTKL